MKDKLAIIVFVAVLILTLMLGLVFGTIALGLALTGSGGAQACGTDNVPASQTTARKPDNGKGVPEKFIPMYQAAAKKYKLGSKGPSTLAAIHGIETGFGDSDGSDGSDQTSTAGAQGPMQFMPATWESYATDGNNDGKKDINNVEDAIFGAARYLRASGAPKNWYDAIFAYNHADWYVQDVQNDAKKFAAQVPANGGDVTVEDGSADCDPSGFAGDFSGDCKAKGLAYGLPSTLQSDREAVFGKADGHTDIVDDTFFGKSVQMHKKVMPCLKAVEAELKARGTTYTVREPIPSLRWPPDSLGWFHPYGAAIDINQSDNPMCPGFDPKGRCGSSKIYDMPREWVRTFQKYGFFWGGNYRTTKDYMHFEWHGEAP